jgi:hypothetical protein
VPRIHQNLIAEQQTGHDFAKSRKNKPTVVSSARFAEVLWVTFLCLARGPGIASRRTPTWTAPERSPSISFCKI